MNILWSMCNRLLNLCAMQLYYFYISISMQYNAYAFLKIMSIKLIISPWIARKLKKNKMKSQTQQG